MRRSTRQSSKPVFLDLRRTENGYEIIEEKVVNLPPIQKPIMTRPDKPLHYSKSLVTKTGEKVPGTPPSSSYHQGDSFMRSRTTIKPPTGPTKIPYPNGANFPERSPVTRPPGDMIKRDPNPYANMSMPPIRMGHPSESN